MKDCRNIVFNIGDENRIVVENITKDLLTSSIFAEPYRYALEALSSYFKSMPKDSKERLEEEQLCRNNVFAFIGDRGSGKTSCMQSIAQLLVSDSNLKNTDEEGKKVYTDVLSETFHKVDMIDPSFVDNESNVVGVILASLYKQYLDFYRQHRERRNEKERVELATCFAKVQRDFCRMMEEEGVKEDDLETLASLSAAIDLKQSMLHLIDKFLTYIGKPNAVLLIPVDDIDLHSKAATKMVEQIRKYLILPNVVVLMAVKMSQLAMLKRLQYSKEYQDERNTLNDTELDEMVEKYLTKLVPYGHRIYMPDATFYWNAKLNVVKNEIAEHKGVSIRQFVPELIFKKTRYLFYNSSIKTCYIVPDNLRELRQLLRLLYDMNDYPIHRNGYDKEGNNNQMVFKKYLFQSWMKNHLDASSQGLIKELLAVTDSIQINAFTLRIIRQKFYEKDDAGKPVAPWIGEANEGIRKELDYIMRKDNMVYNLAIGDVMAVIDYLERLDITSEQMYFLFLVKTFYSIRLYEYYVDYSVSLDEVVAAENANAVLCRNHFEDKHLSDYFKLIGGRFFNTRASLILPVSNKKGSVSRSNRIINLNVLNSLIKDCVDHSDRVSAADIQMAEFFMLCTARVYRSKNKPNGDNDYYEPNFRTNKALVYAAPLNKKPNAFFDIASFLYNVIDVERCYGRFDNGHEFYEKVKSGEHNFQESLFGKLRTANIEKNCKQAEEELNGRQKTGWFCIRNIEVLKDLTVYLDESDYKDSGGDLKKLDEFFSYLATYKIQSYDKSDGADTYCQIDYNFSQTIVDFLRKIKDSDEKMTLFNSIFNAYLNIGHDDDAIEDVEDEDLNAVLARYHEHPLNEEEMLQFVTGEFVLVRKFKDKTKAQYPVFNNPRFTRILNESLPQNANAHVNRDNVHKIYETLEQKIAELIQEVEHGNIEADHQNPVPVAEG